MTAFKIKIVTPQRVEFEGDVTQVTARTSEGNVGIRANHAPYVARLADNGNVELKFESSPSRKAKVSGGMINVGSKETVILLSSFSWIEE